MKKIAFILFVGLVFLACNNNKIKVPNKPDNLLSTSKMADILYDMALVNAAKGTNKKMIQRKGFNPKEFVFNKHNIDSLQFALSNNYYTYYPEVYEDIYEQVKYRLENRKKGYKAILDREKKEMDSLSRLSRRKKDSLLLKRKPGDKADPFLVKKGTNKDLLKNKQK